jgi:hypothetical protein
MAFIISKVTTDAKKQPALTSDCLVVPDRVVKIEYSEPNVKTVTLVGENPVELQNDCFKFSGLSGIYSEVRINGGPPRKLRFGEYDKDVFIKVVKTNRMGEYPAFIEGRENKISPFIPVVYCSAHGSPTCDTCGVENEMVKRYSAILDQKSQTELNTTLRKLFYHTPSKAFRELDAVENKAYINCVLDKIEDFEASVFSFDNYSPSDDEEGQDGCIVAIRFHPLVHVIKHFLNDYIEKMIPKVNLDSVIMISEEVYTYFEGNPMEIAIHYKNTEAMKILLKAGMRVLDAHGDFLKPTEMAPCEYNNYNCVVRYGMSEYGSSYLWKKWNADGERMKDELFHPQTYSHVSNPKGLTYLDLAREKGGDVLRTLEGLKIEDRPLKRARLAEGFENPFDNAGSPITRTNSLSPLHSEETIDLDHFTNPDDADEIFDSDQLSLFQ